MENRGMIFREKAKCLRMMPPNSIPRAAAGRLMIPARVKRSPELMESGKPWAAEGTHPCNQAWRERYTPLPSKGNLHHGFVHQVHSWESWAQCWRRLLTSHRMPKWEHLQERNLHESWGQSAKCNDSMCAIQHVYLTGNHSKSPEVKGFILGRGRESSSFSLAWQPNGEWESSVYSTLSSHQWNPRPRLKEQH